MPATHRTQALSHEPVIDSSEFSFKASALVGVSNLFAARPSSFGVPYLLSHFASVSAGGEASEGGPARVETVVSLTGPADGVSDTVPGDTSTTYSIAVGGPAVSGWVSPVGDRDWYSVNLTAGQTY